MPIIHLEDLDDPRLAAYSGMTDAQLRDCPDSAHGLFIGESRKVIERALAAGVRMRSLFMEEKWLDQTMPLVDLLLDGAEDLRALDGWAAALGIDAVLVTPSCHDPLYRRAARVSMGTVFQVPWTRIGSERAWAAEGVPLLRSLGFATAALALSDEAIYLHDERLRACDKLALVLGTEGDGLAPSTIANCDYTVKIPMDHEVDSLNVAAASAVAFWELRTKWRD